MSKSIKRPRVKQVEPKVCLRCGYTGGYRRVVKFNLGYVADYHRVCDKCNHVIRMDEDIKLVRKEF